MPLRALLLSDGDADAPIELALLQLWAAPDLELLPAELLALDEKCWRRLGLLLFASENSLVLALVAVLGRVVTRVPNSKSSERLLQRVWRSQWRDHLYEKVVDCHARLERECIRPENAGRTDSLSDVDLVAARLVQILVTSLRVILTSSHDDKNRTAETVENGSNDAPKVMAVVDLLLSLSTTVERMPSIARDAAMGLQSLISLETHAFSALVTTHICRSAALQHYVTWLLGDDDPTALASLSEPQTLLSDPMLSKRANDAKHHECDNNYLKLLVAAATVARPDGNKRRGARSPVFDDTAAMLQICTLGVASSDSRIQYSALCLLCSLLALDDASSSALSSAVRLSGILISISWLLNHTISHIAAMAATTLELIIRYSPPSDILRAVIEQGCVIIYRALLTKFSGSMTSPAHAAVAASCRSLLNWVTEEVAWQSGVVAASVQSILSSTNVLLQKNIVLTMQILAQRNATIREALEDQEFQSDAMVTAIQADDEAGLAISVLSICLNCCDKCSTLKIEDFHQDNNNEHHEKDQTPDHAGDLDRTIHLRCAGGELIKTTAHLLREHSNLLHGWKFQSTDVPEGDNSVVVARLGNFRASSVQHFVDVLAMTQHDGVNALVDLQSFSTMQELLRLANIAGSAKCWHVTTSTICRMMTASNWLDIFRFASTEIRHPALVLRCIRFALQLHSLLGPRDTVGRTPQPDQQSKLNPVEQKRADLASALKTAAIQLSQELFLG